MFLQNSYSFLQYVEPIIIQIDLKKKQNIDSTHAKSIFYLKNKKKNCVKQIHSRRFGILNKLAQKTIQILFELGVVHEPCDFMTLFSRHYEKLNLHKKGHLIFFKETT